MNSFRFVPCTMCQTLEQVLLSVSIGLTAELLASFLNTFQHIICYHLNVQADWRPVARVSWSYGTGPGTVGWQATWLAEAAVSNISPTTRLHGEGLTAPASSGSALSFIESTLHTICKGCCWITASWKAWEKIGRLLLVGLGLLWEC